MRQEAVDVFACAILFKVTAPFASPPNQPSCPSQKSTISQTPPSFVLPHQPQVCHRRIAAFLHFSLFAFYHHFNKPKFLIIFTRSCKQAPRNLPLPLWSAQPSSHHSLFKNDKNDNAPRRQLLAFHSIDFLHQPVKPCRTTASERSRCTLIPSCD